MKKLFLLRHAHSTNSLPDFDRVLNAQGIAKCKELAVILAPYSQVIDLILCSSSLRTSQTIQNTLPGNPVHYSRDYYNSSPELLLQYLQGIDSRHNCALLVSHNGAISELGSLLNSDELDFFPGSLALFDCDIDSWEELDPSRCKLVSFWE